MRSAASLAPAQPSPDLADARRLIVAWQHPVSRAIAAVGLLERRPAGYMFAYLANALSVPGFRPILGFGDFRQRYESEQLFPIFRQRIVDHSRPDFRQYMDLLGLDEDASPLNVLGRSGGRRAGDSMFLLREPDIADDGSTRAVFFVHGLRYKKGAAQRVQRLVPGERLLLVRDADNEKNPLAVLVTAKDGCELGWVPDLLAEYVQQVLSQAPPVVQVVKVNGDETPPNLRLLVALQGRVSTGYRPFSGPTWEPLA